jgi:hypothetical protein
MARNLFVAHGDKINRAFGKRCQDGDVGVTAQAEDMFNLAPAQEINDVLCNCLRAHYAISCL